MKVNTFGSDSNEKSDFDNAVCLTGYGRFHYEIIGVCALSILVVGFQNGILSYIFPAAQCELQLTSFHQGLLNIAFLAGATISCFVWGILADMKGRRSVLIVTHLLNASVTILMVSVNPTTASLVACRFLNGFFIGGPGTVIYNYFAEFQPPKYRTTSVCYCGLFFTVAWLLLPLFAYLVLPLNVDIRVGTFFVLTPWRLFLILVAVPEILVGLWLIRMPESPKFYVAKGSPREALEVLRRMYSTNSGKLAEYFPVKNLIMETNEIGGGDKMMCRGKIARIVKEVGEQAKSLFTLPLLGITILTSSIMFANMFGMFGLGLWLPELFIRFEQYQTLYPNATITLSELSSLPTPSKNHSCSPSLDASVIRSTLAMGMTSLLFNGAVSYVSAKTTARMITMVTMILGGLSAGLIYWMRSSVQHLIVACVFQATMIASNMSTAGIAVELFPTKVSGIAVCMVVCAGRIGAVISNFVFGYLMDKQCELPIFIVAAVVILGGCLCLVVPNPKAREVFDMASSFGRNDMEISVVSSKYK